jgi:hypothetical protein
MTDWPVGAAGLEPLHLEIRSAELHPASTGSRRRSGAPSLVSEKTGTERVYRIAVKNPARKSKGRRKAA